MSNFQSPKVPPTGGSHHISKQCSFHLSSFAMRWTVPVSMRATWPPPQKNRLVDCPKKQTTLKWGWLLHRCAIQGRKAILGCDKQMFGAE
jgi:hypothetical protein